MPLPAVLRRPEAQRAYWEDTTVRYQLDARLVRAQRAARQARLVRGDFAARETLLGIAEALRESVGRGADALVLLELDQLGLSLERVPRGLLGQLVVSLARHVKDLERRTSFIRSAGSLLRAAA